MSRPTCFLDGEGTSVEEAVRRRTDGRRRVDLIDVGGESTRPCISRWMPGKSFRILPVIKALKAGFAFVSIRHLEGICRRKYVMSWFRSSLTGLKREPEIVKIAGAGLIMMFNAFDPVLVSRSGISRRMPFIIWKAASDCTWMPA